MLYRAVKSYSVASLAVMTSEPVITEQYRSASSCAVVLITPPEHGNVDVIAGMKAGSDTSDCAMHSLIVA